MAAQAEQAQSILEAEAVVLVAQVAQAVLELSSSPTLVLNVAQAAQLHQSVATQFTHLQVLALTLPNLIF